MSFVKNISAVLMVFALLLSSCRKDDDAGTSDPEKEEEVTKIHLAILDSGITINNAEKIEGNISKPNNLPIFNLLNPETKTFQRVGLDIVFDVKDNYAGAYIQFKDIDGNKSNNHFNVKGFSWLLVEGKSERGLKVNFNEMMPVGAFKFDIYLYNIEGNIFAVSEGEVIVQPWGGKDLITGIWKLKENKVVYSTTILCMNQKDVFLSPIFIEDLFLWEVNYKEDGTFTEVYESDRFGLNENESSIKCTGVYEDEVSSVRRIKRGNWNFDENTQALTVYIFEEEYPLSKNLNEKFVNGKLEFNNVEVKSEDQNKPYFVINDVFYRKK